MMKMIIAGLLMISSLALAGKTDKADMSAQGAAADQDQFKLIHTKDLAKMMAAKDGNVVVLDANNEKTRTTEGVIPGARILTSYDKYDIASELPADKNTKLVFYCANTKCSASHEAANRASQNGYRNVSVMADGIEGWKKAGKQADKYAKPTT